MYTNEKYLLGRVVDIDDPQKIGRIRCEVLGHTEGLPTNILPWYTMVNQNKDTFDLPAINEIVYIKLWDNDIHLGMWKFREFDDRFKDSITNDDYKSAKIILRRYLDDHESDGDDFGGLLAIYYTLSDGLMLKLKDSKINICRDSSIHLYCEKLKKQIHINENQISIGKLNKSDQPAVMGDDNIKQHEYNIEYIKSLCDTMVNAMNELSAAASANPYTSTLTPIFNKYAIDINTMSGEHESKCTNWLPETISELVSLDKKIND